VLFSIVHERFRELLEIETLGRTHGVERMLSLLGTTEFMVPENLDKKKQEAIKYGAQYLAALERRSDGIKRERLRIPYQQGWFETKNQDKKPKKKITGGHECSWAMMITFHLGLSLWVDKQGHTEAVRQWLRDRDRKSLYQYILYRYEAYQKWDDNNALPLMFLQYLCHKCRRFVCCLSP